MSNRTEELTRQGMTLAAEGRQREAVEYFRQATAADATYLPAWQNLGRALHALGEQEASLAAYQRALALAPDSVDLHRRVGALFFRLKEFERAIPHLVKVVNMAPQDATGYGNLGSALGNAGQFEAAAAAYRNALMLTPNNGDYLSSLGGALTRMGQDAEAEACYLEALRLEPQNSRVHYNLGQLHLKRGKLDAAKREFEAAMQLKSDYPEAIGAHSLTLFLSGDFQAAWPGYEKRILLKRTVKHTGPKWDGSPLNGRRLLLEAEQGLGDTIHFIRYCREIKRAHDATVIFACQPKLLRLLKNVEGVDVLIGQDQERPAFDVWTLLTSVPGMFGHALADVPAPIPYLSAEPERVARWKNELSRMKGLKVGITWQGNPTHFEDQTRSFGLDRFAPIAAVPNVTLISLQKGTASEQVAAVKFPVVTFGDDFDADGAFLDTAAVMMNLDLVISADTSIAHVAGALGVPVWVALARLCDWRWTMHGETTPWYPTMRLFRQADVGQWGPVFEGMAAAIAQR